MCVFTNFDDAAQAEEVVGRCSAAAWVAKEVVAVCSALVVVVRRLAWASACGADLVVAWVHVLRCSCPCAAVASSEETAYLLASAVARYVARMACPPFGVHSYSCQQTVSVVVVVVVAAAAVVEAAEAVEAAGAVEVAEAETAAALVS